MLWRKSKLISELRAEIQRLRELLAEAIGARDAYREQAREAIGLAKEKHFPEGREGYTREDAMRQVAKGDKVFFNGKELQEGTDYERKGETDFTIYWSSILPDPDPFSVKNCPECCVSVRSDKWPVACPACNTSFGDEEWADTVE